MRCAKCKFMYRESWIILEYGSRYIIRSCRIKALVIHTYIHAPTDFAEMPGVSVAVIDQLPVGTPEILNSPHVSEGPGRIARAPVPSIFVDDRGDIHRLRVGHQRLNLLYSKQGVMRSGYLHPHPLHSIVISGEVEVWTLGESGTIKTTYSQYQNFTIPPYVPHILHFPRRNDTILAEWWSPPTAEFQCYYYHPYRKMIDIQNSVRLKEMDDHNNNDHSSISTNSGTTTGRHQRLVPQDEAQLACEQTWPTSSLFAIGLALSDPLVDRESESK
jgi:hypothetical protein